MQMEKTNYASSYLILVYVIEQYNSLNFFVSQTDQRVLDKRTKMSSSSAE